MSLHKIERDDGSVVWRVRWRDGGRGSAARSRTFTRKADAQRFEDELRRRRRLGEIGLLVGSQETLDKYVTETWAPTHAVTLAPATAKGYAALYDKHISPYLGHLKLIEITPEAIARWQADRIAAGAGRVSIFKAHDGARVDPAAGARGRADRAQSGAAGAQGPPAAEDRGSAAGARRPSRRCGRRATGGTRR